MSRRTMQNDAAVPSLASLAWLAFLMLGVAVAVVLVYHFLLASHTGVFSPAKAAPAPVVDDIGGAHADALREAMGASPKK